MNDISAPLLAACRNNIAAFSDRDVSKFCFLRGDANDLSFKEGMFDLVIGGSALHHILDYRGFIERVFAALRPGGKLVTSEPMAPAHRLIVMVLQLEMYISELQGSPFSAESKETVNSYCNNLLARASNGIPNCALAALDDKHIFSEKDLHVLSQRVGFHSLEIVPNSVFYFEDSPPPQNVAESLINDILLNGLSIEKPDSSGVVARLIDRVFPDLFATHLPPSSYLVFTK